MLTALIVLSQLQSIQRSRPHHSNHGDSFSRSVFSGGYDDDEVFTGAGRTSSDLSEKDGSEEVGVEGCLGLVDSRRDTVRQPAWCTEG